MNVQMYRANAHWKLCSCCHQFIQPVKHSCGLSQSTGMLNRSGRRQCIAKGIACEYWCAYCASETYQCSWSRKFYLFSSFSYFTLRYICLFTWKNSPGAILSGDAYSESKSCKSEKQMRQTSFLLTCDAVALPLLLPVCLQLLMNALLNNNKECPMQRKFAKKCPIVDNSLKKSKMK